MRYGKSAIALSGVMVLGWIAGAAPVRGALALPFVDHFTADEFGAGTNPSGQLPTYWTSSGTGGATDVRIVDTSTDSNPSPDGGQAMLIHSSGKSALLPFETVDSGILELRFQIRINDDTNEDYVLRPSTNRTYVRFRASGAGTSDGFSYITGPGTNRHAFLGTVHVGDWYQFVETLNLDTQKWSLFVENLTKKGTPDAQSAFVDDLDFWVAGSSVGNFQFVQTSASYSFNATVDSVGVRMVPEPASLSLLGLGGLLMLRRRRR